MNLTKEMQSYLFSKKTVIRDTIMVLIPTVITIAYLIIVVILDIDMSPGPNYLKSMFMNFLGPLLLISVSTLAYQIVLVSDMMRVAQAGTISKIVICLCVWCFWPLVYIAKIVVFCLHSKSKKNEYQNKEPKKTSGTK